jgi:hypothetical protein
MTMTLPTGTAASFRTAQLTRVLRVCFTKGVSGGLLLGGFGGQEPVGEGDRECVQG